MSTKPPSDPRPLRPTEVLVGTLLLFVAVGLCLALFVQLYYQIFVQERDSFAYVGTGFAGRLIRRQSYTTSRRGSFPWESPGWVFEVKLPTGQIVEATMSAMPRRGDELCVIRRSSGPVSRREYLAFPLLPDGALPNQCKST